ncbi:MAG: GGDEF domain-containing protein [Janthinobacterium lividum]
MDNSADSPDSAARLPVEPSRPGAGKNPPSQSLTDESLPPPPPAAFPHIYGDAEVRQRFARIVSEYGEHPLVDEIAWFSERYLRLAGKLDKIARISDRLQAQVIDSNKALSERAASDPLTGLLNRSGALHELRLSRERLAREGAPFGLLMIDLDHFKTINDRFGHAAGDQVLLCVAHTLRANTRSTDACARWGGEEFLVVLPTTDMRGLEAVANKLLAAIRGVGADAAAAAGQEDSHAPQVGSSIGIYLVQSIETPEESVRRADAALYYAKRNGRGQVARYSTAMDKPVPPAD